MGCPPVRADNPRALGGQTWYNYFIPPTIQILQPDTSKKTYRDMTMAKQRGSKSECCFSNSIQSQTRTKQGEVDSQLSCHVQSDVKIPEWKRASINSKANLTQFYTIFLA